MTINSMIVASVCVCLCAKGAFAKNPKTFFANEQKKTNEMENSGKGKKKMCAVDEVKVNPFSLTGSWGKSNKAEDGFFCGKAGKKWIYSVKKMLFV